MPTRLEKTAAFLNKLAQGQSFMNSNWLGLGDQSDAKPFTQYEDLGSEAPKEKSLASNYWDALKRGHTGTVLATGGAALLAGVLAYNMLKKKQTKTAAHAPDVVPEFAPDSQAAAFAKKPSLLSRGQGFVRDNRGKLIAGGIAGLAAGGTGLAYGLSGDDPSLVDQAKDKASGLWDDYTGALKGEKGTGAQIGAIGGTAAVAAIPLYLLYRKLRGKDAQGE